MSENKEVLENKKDGQVSFKDTLNLPTTDFPIRPNAKEDDPKMIARWTSQDMYKKTFEKNAGNEKFILHDGPPFANGHLHLGHAYNKVLKDIVTKSQRMMGKYVPVTPGWDCHGLPIEFNVTKENPGLSKVETKKKCREYAQRWIDIQKEEFRALGVMMDFEHPYVTMDYAYEANIMRAFGEFVDQGYIERKNKTVAWCYDCNTVLASAEIEYHDRKDPSIYVQFPLEAADSKKLFPEVDGKVSLLIWTTTPWTLPLNRAVVVKPKEKYVVLNVNGKNVILHKSLVQKLCAVVCKDGQEGKVLLEFDAEHLSGLRASHPFVENLTVPVIFDPFVQIDEGTACVHCAPGCGQEDYEVGVKNGLEIFSPVGPDGRYCAGIMPQELEGLPVVIGESAIKKGDSTVKAGPESSQATKENSSCANEQISGQVWVIKKLLELDLLLHKASIKHSYPHCWRCRNGLIFRATKQWFCDLSKNNFRERALAACDTINTLPENSINRLKAAIESRLEWCLSRQRVWGVPITALICNKCDKTFVSKEFINIIADQVQNSGTEYWDTVSMQELDTLIAKEFDKIKHQLVCQNCGSKDFSKEMDILDVWFESGVTHYAVLSQRKELGYPADMYLEGKDQHRGWFQSSLLTSLVLHKDGTPCMKNIVTHGFTVDQKGVKMSKSLGNVVSPAQMVEKLSTDGLRLWAANIDFSSEAIVSDILIKNVQEVFRKIRNTQRFLLSNLYDFEINRDAVSLDKMLPIDKYAFQTLYKLNEEIILDYEKFNFTAVAHKLADYVTKDLSSYYLDIIKDRLYVEKNNGHVRRSAQTVCWYILDTLTKLVAPIMSFTAEQVSDCYQKDKEESIHLQNFANLQEQIKTVCNILPDKSTLKELTGNYCQTHEKIDLIRAFNENEKVWAFLEQVRSVVLKAIEVQREQQIMKHSLEANVTIFFDIASLGLSAVVKEAGENAIEELRNSDLQNLEKFYDMLKLAGQDVESFFKEFFIVSQFKIVENSLGLERSGLEGIFVKVEKAVGIKCPRCWNWSGLPGENDLCPRCQKVLGA